MKIELACIYISDSHDQSLITLLASQRLIEISTCKVLDVVMILPQVHLRKPGYDFTFL